MATITISLPEPLKQFVEAQSINKGFGDVGAYVRSLLQDAQIREEDADLERLLLDGLSTSHSPLDEDFRARLKAKATAILERHVRRPGV